MFFISGITGRTGGTAARRLLQGGYKVRTMVRDPAKAAAWSQQGVDVRQGDFNHPGMVAEALSGVEGAYLMLPPNFAPAPGFPETKAVIASFRAALLQAPPPRLVVLSSIGSERSSALGLITQTHLLEEALSDAPFPVAFIRAGSFLDNYTAGLQAAASTGWLDSFLTPVDRAFPMIATEDIGQQAAQLLMDGWSGRKIVELGSPVSPEQVAQAMSHALSQPIQARAIPRQQWAAILGAYGFPPGGSGAFEEMEDGFNSGWIDFGVPGTEPVPATITPDEFFERAKKAVV